MRGVSGPLLRQRCITPKERMPSSCGTLSQDQYAQKDEPCSSFHAYKIMILL